MGRAHRGNLGRPSIQAIMIYWNGGTEDSQERAGEVGLSTIREELKGMRTERKLFIGRNACPTRTGTVKWEGELFTKIT